VTNALAYFSQSKVNVDNNFIANALGTVIDCKTVNLPDFL